MYKGQDQTKDRKLRRQHKADGSLEQEVKLLIPGSAQREPQK